MAEPLQALRWDGKRILELLDQTKLPDDIVYFKAFSSPQVSNCIKRLVVRGAPNIGVAGAFGLAMQLQIQPGKKTARAAYQELLGSRPTAVNLAYCLGRVRLAALKALNRGGASAGAAMALAAREEAELILQEEESASTLMADAGAHLWEELGHGNFLTICNTGRLAAPGYGTALGTILRRHERYRHAGQMVYVLETRPLLQGLRLTALELSLAGIHHEVIVDGLAGSYMSAVDAVVVGADRIASNGDVINKVGTRTLAILADYHDVPLYVVAPTSTLDSSLPRGDRSPIELRSPLELTSRPILDALNSAVRNQAFDVTPHYLVTGGYITENGHIQPARDPANPPALKFPRPVPILNT